MESDWPRSREPEADPEPSPHPPDRSGRPTSSPTDPSDRNLRQPSGLARPEAPWRPPVGAPSPPRSPQQLPPFGLAHGEARRKSRSPADIPASMVESRGGGSCRNNSGRNDALSFATLAERNDVLSFSAERCPVGSHLALGGKAPRGPEGWIAKGDTFALDPAAEQIPAVAHPLPTWLPHKEW